MSRRGLRGGVATVLATLVVALTSVVAVPAPPAAAEPPPEVEDRVTDRADVLGREERAQIEAALEDLETSTTMRLTVVLVDTFDPPEEGLEGFTFMVEGEWAEITAERSGLGDEDVLLAVAVDERRYEWALGDGVPLTGDEVRTMMDRDVAPRLSDQQWADAAVAAARGLENPSGPWWRNGWLQLIAALVGLVGLGLLYERLGGRRRSSSQPDDDDPLRWQSRSSSSSSSRPSSRGSSGGRRSGGGRF